MHLETEATLFLYLPKLMKKDIFHLVQTHKTMKLKDGYTLTTYRVVSGPPPPPKAEIAKKKRWS